MGGNFSSVVSGSGQLFIYNWKLAFLLYLEVTVNGPGLGVAGSMLQSYVLVTHCVTLSKFLLLPGS